MTIGYVLDKLLFLGKILQGLSVLYSGVLLVINVANSTLLFFTLSVVGLIVQSALMFYLLNRQEDKPKVFRGLLLIFFSMFEGTVEYSSSISGTYFSFSSNIFGGLLSGLTMFMFLLTIIVSIERAVKKNEKKDS